jgi:cell division protein FtsQ
MITGSWISAERRVGLPRIMPRRLLSWQTLALVLALAAVGWIGWTWFRSSSFVKVKRVTVTGLSGPDVAQIRDALTETALGRTTLHIQVAKLEAAVEAYPYVHSLTVSKIGSHAVVIQVDEQVPVALVNLGGNAQLVDGAGLILSSSTVPHEILPTVPITASPAGDTITAHGARAALAVLAAAPYSLLSHVANATSSSRHGVVVQLRGGPQLYFGPTTQLHEKWEAATAVLQDSGAAGAAYIDVSDPQRPAAGVGVSTKQAIALGLASPPDAPAGTTTSAGSSAAAQTAVAGASAGVSTGASAGVSTGPSAGASTASDTQ